MCGLCTLLSILIISTGLTIASKRIGLISVGLLKHWPPSVSPRSVPSRSSSDLTVEYRPCQPVVLRGAGDDGEVVVSGEGASTGADAGSGLRR